MLPFFLFGQENQPKVGLVLSGGGAKGFAHIPILKEIDKAGIQIDYIAGTSMGAIIGGMYAAGYSANQIEELVNDIDFMSLLRDKLPRSASSFFEKEYEEKTGVTLPVNKGTIGLPKAISKGQNVVNLLSELFKDTESITDFSKLPIPFFCIATDVENGKEVIIDSGSLVMALRASGSFPTLLNPVELNGKLLVDGGVVNNFPINLMKKKGMDIIIGVDVEGKLVEKENLNSAISILNQIVTFQMYNKTDEEKKKVDVYVHPDIFNFTVVDFEKKEEILQKGVEEAVKFQTIFKEIADKQFTKRTKKLIQTDFKKKYISKINLEGIGNYTRAYVLGKMKIRSGDSLSRSDISKKIQLLQATKNYEMITYTFQKQPDNSYQLNLFVKETTENASLSFGAHYDFLYRSALLVNYRQKHFLLKNDMVSVDAILGDNLRFNFNYFVDNGFYISFGFRSRFNHFRTNARFAPIIDQYPGVNSINVKYTDITNQIFTQTTFGRKFAIGGGFEHKILNINTETISVSNNDNLKIEESKYFSLFGYIKIDTYDQKFFVTKGYFADLNFKWYLASSDYNHDFKQFAQAKGTIGFATSFNDKLTFQLTNEAGFTLNNPSSPIFDFYLGDYNKNYINTFVPFYGYDFTELSDNSFVKSEFTFRYQFYKNHYAVAIANYARLENNVFKDIDLFDNVHSGYAIGYSFNSMLGPIEFKYSWSPTSHQQHWLFNLGFWF